MSNHSDGSTPAPSGGARVPASQSTRSEIDAFLNKVKSLAPVTGTGERGRLIFALDATMSRQPTWDTACRLQADMFREAAAIGGLDEIDDVLGVDTLGRLQDAFEDLGAGVLLGDLGEIRAQCVAGAVDAMAGRAL